MLWGKKILEWSATPREALDVMIELNNKYALDGRDPNSYTGIFWCLGRYDRPWAPERPVFGTVRYMSSESARRKLKLWISGRWIAVAPASRALARKGRQPFLGPLSRSTGGGSDRFWPCAPALLLAPSASPPWPAPPTAIRGPPCPGGSSGSRRRAGGWCRWRIENLGTGARLGFQDTEILHAASTMKVPVMMALFEAVDRGQMRLDEPVRVANDFASIVDGSRYVLDRKEDGDPELYAALGQTRTLEELIRRMIVRSSNLATNLLIEKIGATNVTDLMRRLGAYDIQVLRGVEDQKAYEAGLNNRVTAKDLLLSTRSSSTARPSPRPRATGCWRS